MKGKLLLRVDDKLWERFKMLVPRTTKLNDAVVELIEKYVEENEGVQPHNV